ncbi:hypothetical protein V9K67_02530 [Paraflavisolibacter sp. H34]|uniref:hypothetical protein n=1 Tax=Huijunlia imazamoxiresistens TaxID=3127457 RepID=UPI003016DDD1
MSNPIQNKLLNFEVPPPEHAWNKIQSALEQDSEFLLSRKLHNYQQPPSSQVWENIKARLDQENGAAPAPSVVQPRRFPQYLPAAAAVLIAALLGLLFLLRPPSEEPAVAAGRQQTPVPQTTPPPPLVTARAGADKRHAPPSFSPLAKATAPTDRQPSMGKADSPLPLPGQDISATLPSGRYMMVAGTTGYAVKVSKKLYDLFACSEMDFYCRQQIELLQQRVASSDVVATAGVNSVLDLLKTLENKQ